MESTEAGDHLDQVARLQEATVAESLQGDRTALVVLALATVLFVASYQVGVDWQPVVAPVIWIVFIVGWVRWLRRRNRALYTRRAEITRRDVIEWLTLLGIAMGIAVVGDRVSWTLAGWLFGLLGTAAGTREALIARRRLRSATER